MYTLVTQSCLVLIYNPSMQGQADTHTPSPSWWSAWRLYKPSTAALVQRWRSASPPRTPSGQRYPSQPPWSCRRAPFLIPFTYPHQQLVTGAVLTQHFFGRSCMHIINIVWLARPSLARLVYATHVHCMRIATFAKKKKKKKKNSIQYPTTNLIYTAWLTKSILDPEKCTCVAIPFDFDAMPLIFLP